MNNTNINEVVVDILTGVKIAGKEIYGASKETIVNLVSLIKEQSPDLFNQFITLQLYESIFYFFLVLIPSIFFGYISFCLNKKYKETEDFDYLGWKWVTATFAIAILMINLSINGANIVKISVAPKIYMIEYIAHAIKR